MKEIITIIRLNCALCLGLIFCAINYSAEAQDLQKITIRSVKAGESVYMLYCDGDFGGGNVTASVGKDGVLIADNMYAKVTPKLQEAIKALSDKPIRYALNSHFHGDHIQGNEILSSTATIIAHTNLRKRVGSKQPAPAPGALPVITFSDSLNMYFNGEEIRLIHLPSGHTDTDVVIYFTGSKVVHMGDMFFFGMFPAVYKQGGGDIKQLIVNIDKVINNIPADAKVVPGHGDLATVSDLKDYLTMLKETTALVEEGIKKGKTLDQMKTEKILIKYDKLGEGGAQTTDQYTTMLFGLLSPKK
jgi:cyclase